MINHDMVTLRQIFKGTLDFKFRESIIYACIKLKYMLVLQDTNASAITASETRPAAPVAKATPKKVKASTQTDESKQKPQEPKNREIEKPEESDTNSDEFPEEKEYEKISRRKLEDEMKQSDNVESVDNSSSQKEKEQKASESGAKNKTCLEVGGGDN